MGIQSDLLDTGPAKFMQSQALTGTVATTGTALTGAGTMFLTELVVGQYVYEPVKRGVRKIASITNDTAAVLDLAFNSNVPALTKLYAFTDTGDTKGGVDVEWATSTYMKETDRLGIVGEIISDRRATVTVPLSDWKPENLNRAMADVLAVIKSSGKVLARMSKSIGLDLSSLGAPAMIIPIINGADTTDPNRIVVFHNLCPSAEALAIKYAATQQRPIVAKFGAWAMSDGEIGYIGDNTIRP